MFRYPSTGKSLESKRSQESPQDLSVCHKLISTCETKSFLSTSLILEIVKRRSATGVMSARSASLLRSQPVFNILSITIKPFFRTFQEESRPKPTMKKGQKDQDHAAQEDVQRRQSPNPVGLPQLSQKHPTSENGGKRKHHPAKHYPAQPNVRRLIVQLSKPACTSVVLDAARTSSIPSPPLMRKTRYRRAIDQSSFGCGEPMARFSERGDQGASGTDKAWEQRSLQEAIVVLGDRGTWFYCVYGLR